MKAMTVSNAVFRRFLVAAAASVMMSAAYVPAAVAQAPAVTLPDFTSIVEDVGAKACPVPLCT